MTISHVASTGVKAAIGEGSTVDVFTTDITVGNMAFIALTSYEETKAANTLTGWTLLGTQNANDSTFHAAPTDDQHATRLSVWYRVLDGSEPAPPAGFISMTGVGTWNTAQADMQVYSLTSGNSWATPIIVSGADNTHNGTGSSITCGTWASGVSTNDWIIYFFSSDTDNAITISTGSISQSGVTFGTPATRTRYGSNTGVDCGIYGFDVSVTSASASTSAPTIGFTQTAGTSNCNAGIAVRLREIAANPPQTVNLSLITDTSVGQTFTSVKQKALALSSTTDVAQITTKQKMKAIALTSITNTAQTFTYSRQQTVNLITNTQTAQTVTARFSGRVNLVTETDSAFTHGKKKSRELALLISDNFVQTLAGQHQLAIGLAETTGIAQALNKIKLDNIEVVLEDYVVQPLTIGRRKAINLVVSNNLAIVLGSTYRLFQVIESDSIPATQQLKRRTLALLTETDIVNDIHPFHTALVSQILEAETAQPLHIIYSRLVHQATETDVPNSIHPIHTDAVGTVFETDFAQVIDNFVKQKLLTLVTGSDIAVAVGPKLQHPPSSIILDVVIPDPTQLTVTVLDSDVIVLVSQRF